MTLDTIIISEEQANVDELRVRFKGRIDAEMYEDDNLFQRFLRARNQNIDAAEAMLRKHLNWRKSNKIAALLTEYTPPEVLQKHTSLDLIGYNTDGTPVIYSQFGDMDTRGLVKSCPSSEICTYVAWRVEVFVNAMKEQTKKRKTLVDQLVIVINFEHFSLASATHKPTIENIIALVQMYDANFPERLKTAYIINASLYFTLAWTLVKPFLAGQTFQKIKIFGKDDWHDVLHKDIDINVLPAFLGGKLTDPDGDVMCRTLVRFPGPVPESYYRKNLNETRIPNSKKLVVSRMSKAEVQVQVPEAEWNIEWEFEVKNRDIAFGLIQKDKKKEDEKELIEKQRIETSLCSESGLYQCSEPGTYFLQFDNSYSWLHNKEIYYTVAVVKPKLVDAAS